MQRVVRAVTLAGLLVGGADAHVSPGVTDNNRYLKLSPAADRVRLAYTVFYGKEPGAALRPSLDTDASGQISDVEGQAFAGTLADEVARALEVTIDGRTIPVWWATAAVGMGSPETKAGAFSIDFVAWLCLPSVRGTHTVLVRDRFRIPNPGETEIKVEDALGITIGKTTVGPTASGEHEYKFLGPGGPLSDDGLALTFTASENAPLGDSTCASAAGTGGRFGLPPVIIVGVAAVIGALLAFFIARRISRGTKRTP